MKSFIARHADKITGVLSGFDRLVLRGTLRQLAYVGGFRAFLWRKGVLFKDFGEFVRRTSDRLKLHGAARSRVRGLGAPRLLKLSSSN